MSFIEPKGTPSHLRVLLDASPDGVAIFGPAGRLLDANGRFGEIYGLSGKDVAALSFDQYRRYVLDRVADHAWPAVEAALGQLAPDRPSKLEIELELVRPETRFVRLWAAPVTDSDGRCLGQVSFHRDMTDQRRFEQELGLRADLPDINPFPVLKCDAEGHVRFTNLAAEKLLANLGLPCERVTEILPSDYRKHLRAVVERWSGPLRLLHEYGDRWLSLTVSADPQRAECMVVVEDVTEHRLADEKIKRYASELEVANRRIREAQAALVQSEKMASLGNLVAGIAHEINTPVGSINANSDVTIRALAKLRTLLASSPREGTESPDVERMITMLEELGQVSKSACERIVNIVRSLRNFARLDEADRKKADLHEGLESTLTLVNHLLKDRVQVIRDYGNIPEIECYPSQLNQVFTNILVNAAQAIKGKGTITIVTRSDGRKITVVINDTGTGIRPEHVAKIFDPGFTTKGVGVGAGLGLAISYKIVTDHGGHVDVDTEAGRGTTFTITLPVS